MQRIVLKVLHIFCSFRRALSVDTLVRLGDRQTDTKYWYVKGGSGSGTGNEAVVRHGARRGPKVRCSDTQTHVGNLIAY